MYCSDALKLKKTVDNSKMGGKRVKAGREMLSCRKMPTARRRGRGRRCARVGDLLLNADRSDSACRRRRQLRRQMNRTKLAERMRTSTESPFSLKRRNHTSCWHLVPFNSCVPSFQLFPVYHFQRVAFFQEHRKETRDHPKHSITVIIIKGTFSTL